MPKFLNRSLLLRTAVAIAIAGLLYAVLIAWPRYQTAKSDSATSNRSQLYLTYKEIAISISSGHDIRGSSPVTYAELTSIKDRLSNAVSVIESTDSIDTDEQDKKTSLLRNLEDVVADYDAWDKKAGKAMQYSPRDDLGRLELSDEGVIEVERRLSATIVAIKALIDDPSRPVLTDGSMSKLRTSLTCFEESYATLKSKSTAKFKSRIALCDKLHSEARAQLISQTVAIFDSAAAKEAERLAKELSTHSD